MRQRRPGSRRLSDDEARRLMVVSGNLASLSQHPAWPDLKQAIADHEEKLRKITLAEMFGGPTPVNQRNVDFRRGFMQGMDYMVKVCEGAESRLENYLQENAVEGSGS